MYFIKRRPPKPKRRIIFIQEVVESLADEYLNSKHKATNEKATGNRGERGVITLPDQKKKDCVVCSDRKTNNRKRSSEVCKLYNAGCHAKCVFKHKCL